MHERFGRQWEEKWEVRGGNMWPYPAEYYRLQRKELYEDGCKKRNAIGEVERWEHDGYGYVLCHCPGEQQPWVLSRTDLQQYHSVVYQFHWEHLLRNMIEMHGWQSENEQLVLAI